MLFSSTAAQAATALALVSTYAQAAAVPPSVTAIPSVSNLSVSASTQTAAKAIARASSVQTPLITDSPGSSASPSSSFNATSPLTLPSRTAMKKPATKKHSLEQNVPVAAVLTNGTSSTVLTTAFAETSPNIIASTTPEPKYILATAQPNAVPVDTQSWAPASAQTVSTIHPAPVKPELSLTKASMDKLNSVRVHYERIIPSILKLSRIDPETPSLACAADMILLSDFPTTCLTMNEIMADVCFHWTVEESELESFWSSITDLQDVLRKLNYEAKDEPGENPATHQQRMPYGLG